MKLKEYIEQKYPSNDVINQIGAPINSANRKVTFNVMYKMSMNSQNIRSFFRIYKKLFLNK